MAKLVPNTQTGSLTDHQHGTNDTLIGVDNADNTLFGDAFAMYDKSHGGDDALTGALVRTTRSMVTPSPCTINRTAATTR